MVAIVFSLVIMLNPVKSHRRPTHNWHVFFYHFIIFFPLVTTQFFPHVSLFSFFPKKTPLQSRLCHRTDRVKDSSCVANMFMWFSKRRVILLSSLFHSFPCFIQQKDTTDRVRIQTILSMDYSSFLLRAYVKGQHTSWYLLLAWHHCHQVSSWDGDRHKSHILEVKSCEA
jgi:magnesium-transporting ATPase (P-type)